MSTSPTSYYRLLDRTSDEEGVVVAKYESTLHAQGAWNDHEQHMAPATGVIANELEQFQPRDDMRIARISLDIWGLIHFGNFEIETKLIRPGRTIELIESRMISKGRPCIVARAWRLQTRDSSSIAGLEDAPVVSYKDLPPWDGMNIWPGGYIASLKVRVAPGHRPGKGIVWLSTPYTMVEEVQPSGFVRLLGLVDTMNGVVPRVNALEVKWGYPNVDLQIHMHRSPEGDWLGIEGQQQYAPDGIGLTSAILHDEHGPFGRAEQILTLRSFGE